MEQQIREAVKLESVDDGKVKALDKNKYVQHLVDKQLEEAVNQQPEIAIQVIRELLFASSKSREAVMNSKTFDKWVEKFGDFVLSDKYDKIEALSDYALGKFNPDKEKINKYYKL